MTATKGKPAKAKKPCECDKPKLKLVKVRVQPVLQLDHGDHLSDVTITDPDGKEINITENHPVISIPASEWPTYSSERFPREIAEWQARLDAGE